MPIGPIYEPEAFTSPKRLRARSVSEGRFPQPRNTAGKGDNPSLTLRARRYSYFHPFVFFDISHQNKKRQAVASLPLSSNQAL